MVKLVDTKDLKSLPFWECQFESGRGHQKIMINDINIIADRNSKSEKIKLFIKKNLKINPFKKNKLIVVIGGDGFMLQTLKKNIDNDSFFYGINSGNYGFLMNKFNYLKTIKNLHNAKKIIINPLEMIVKNKKNKIKKLLAINEVSVLRQTRQASNLAIKKQSKFIIKKLVADGVLVSTPAGSTAYNLSVYGQVLNLNSNKISIAPISAFRPRLWKPRIINNNLNITIINLDTKKRPVSAVADNREVRNVKIIKIQIKKKIKFNLLYDKNNSLQKKIKIEQLIRNTNLKYRYL